MDKVLKARAVRIRESHLRDERCVYSVGLDVSYLSVLPFQRPLESNRPASRRKRRKTGLPGNRFLEFQVWIGRGPDSLRQVKAELGFSDPLDAPAVLSVEAEEARDIREGDLVELRIVEVVRRG
jgi:hypothetical protein